MHIAFVTPESPYGDELGCGIAAYLSAIVPALADAGHRVTVIANAREEKVFDAEKGRVAVHHFRLPSLHWYFAKLPLIRNLAPLPLRQLEWSRAFYRQAAKVAASKPIDVIESTETGSLFLNRIAPVVIRLHGSERSFREHSGMPVSRSVKWSDGLEATACQRASALSSPSQFHADEITTRRGWPTDRVHVIPNPVSANLLDVASEFRRNGNQEKIVLYTGRLAPVKGIETLVAAARRVLLVDPSIRFVLAGPWQLPGAPASYGLNGNSPEQIRWVGPQTREQIVDWYKKASVVVIPSDYETFGISAIEAIAFGVPVVATGKTAVSEVVGNDFASFVPQRDPQALADRILDTITTSLTPAPSSAIRDELERFQPASVAVQTLKLYESLHR